MIVQIQHEIDRQKYLEYLAMGKAFSEWYGENMVSAAVRYGYGYYGATLLEDNGKYYVRYERGDNCD